MKKQYDVTIGIPVYNAARYLKQALDAALAQDCDSVELLVLDDCSTDGSIDLVRHYQQAHSRGCDIRIVSQPENKGIGAGRNRLIDEARGEWLYFLDADDLMQFNTVSLLLKAGREASADVVMAGHERLDLYGGRNERTKVSYSDQLRVLRGNELGSYAFARYGALGANIWNVLLRLDFLRGYSLRFVNTNFWEDMVFKIRLLTYADCGVILPDITYTYVCRENTLSNFQHRKHIDKDEILCNAASVATLMPDWYRLVMKPYFYNWLNTVLKTEFYVACAAIKDEQRITPPLSNRELRAIVRTPLSFYQTLRFTGPKNLMLSLLGWLPPRLCRLALVVLGSRQA